MKILSKIFVSTLILILVIVVYLLPEQTISDTKNSIADNYSGYSLIEDGFSNKSPDSYGSIDVNETEKHGYGYIKNRQKEKDSFGLIEFDNKLSDSVFVKSVKSRFLTDDIKYYKASGISYAFINGKQLYIENTGISEITGFNGSINLAIVVNINGVLDSLVYLSSEETPSYINKILKTGYFNQYVSLKLEDKHTVDAVSGATITSIAIAKSVNEIFTLSQQKLLNNYMTGNYSNFNVVAKLNKIWIVNLTLLIILFVLLSFKKFRKRKILIFISIFTIAWLGFYLNTSFTYLLFIKSFTSASLSIFIIAYILIVLASTIWYRNTYCKHICPFGNTQRLVYKISPFKNRKNVFRNKHLKVTRYLVSVFVIAGYVSGFEIFSEYELFQYFFSANTSYLMFGISVMFVLISIRIPNFWCRALCPTGCVLDTVSNISESRFQIKKHRK